MTSMHDRDGWIWNNGNWLPWREATTHMLNHTLHYGMGCFEGVRAYQGATGTHIFRLHDHTRRLIDSAHSLDMNLEWSIEALNQVQCAAVVRNGLANAYIKPTVYFGSEGMGLRAQGLSTNIMIPAWDLGDYLSPEAARIGLSALTSSWSRHHVNISLCRAKTNGHYVNSMLALNTAVKAGFDETLMLDPEGYVAEASAANVFLWRDGCLHTPEITSCLQGITRDTVIELARKVLKVEVRERRITRDELYTADEAFLTGTAAEILPLRRLDGRVIGNRSTGLSDPEQAIGDATITAQLQRLYHRLVRGDLGEDLSSFSAWLTPVE